MTAHAGPRRAEGPERTDVMFMLLLALVSTSIAYRFGSGNQLEQIPIILRKLDATYLNNDFFVSSSVTFGPRTYFATLLAWICRAMPLFCAYLILTYLSDLALIAITVWVARRVVGTDRLGAAIAAVLTVAASGFHLGDATQIRYEVFQPASLAIPPALLAIGLGLRGKPILAAIAASLASLPHPLYGAQGGAIALAAGFLVLLTAREANGIRDLQWARAVVATSVGALVLGATILVFWWLPLQGVNAGVELSNAEMFDIMARFRAPHHYLPSQFRPLDYLTAALFATAAVLAFDHWRRSVPSRTAILFLVPPAAVIAACMAGAVFTELIPSRVAVTLQPFRLLSIFKWSAFLLIAATFSRCWQRPPHAQARTLTGLSMLSSGGTYPLVTSVALYLLRPERVARIGVGLPALTAVVAVVAVALWLAFGSLAEALVLVIACGLLVAFFLPKPALRIGSTLAVASLSLFLFTTRNASPIFVAPALVPTLKLDDLQDIDAVTAREAATRTPPNALFVTPPSFSVLRIVGQRALVVDFKAIPLQDAGMREWRERIRRVYGEVQGGGFTALAALEDAWRSTNDARLSEIARAYGATHALLYAGTQTALPVIYANASYRVVTLQP